MIEDPTALLGLVIDVLKAIVLVLLAILLYRVDRIIASWLQSSESLETAFENVEEASETLKNFANLASKIPFVGNKIGKKRDVEVE